MESKSERKLYRLTAKALDEIEAIEGLSIDELNCMASHLHGINNREGLTRKQYALSRAVQMAIAHKTLYKPCFRGRQQSARKSKIH